MNRTQGVHLSISNKSCFDTKKFYYQGFRFNEKYYNISKKKKLNFFIYLVYFAIVILEKIETFNIFTQKTILILLRML
jgi:hypothetical protein